jgi:hypothetical protein
MAAAAAAPAGALRLALVAAVALALASAQLPNFRMALPPDVDLAKRMDVQAGYELLSCPSLDG